MSNDNVLLLGKTITVIFIKLNEKILNHLR